LEQLDGELQHEAGALVMKHERHVAEICEEKSRDIMITALQRYAASHTAETTTSTVDIPNDDMKGRIIGREGRNICAFEKATGVDVIIDDTPGVVIVSGFDMVRREVARISLSKLIADGRIHPTRIEEIVAETQVELEKHLQQLGQEAAQEADVSGLHPKIIHLLGRLRFRTSYSQNVLRHSIEVAFLTGMMAEEIGLDGRLARRCGLLHDIGKAADHEAEGGHPKIGADILKRHNERPEVVHAALGHHDDLRIDNPYTVLVAAADACSASRPGARRETLERYIKRMEELETIACGFPGVDHAFAIQAGRELRVLASAKDTTDASAAKICHDIAKAFEEQLTYPGEIKVTVLRESRFTEMAR
jgi:ribonuclease Y